MTTEEVEQAISTARDNRCICLSFRRKEISVLPNSIGNLTNLTELKLNGNQLTSLPDSIGNLTNLTELNLDGNQLASLPDSIGNLTNLTRLCLGINQLTSLPDSIGNLTNLTELKLDGNQLTSLPDSIRNLPSLTRLYLSSNQLTSLPDSIENLTNLTHIELSNNPLIDLSILVNIPNLKIGFFHLNLSHRYRTKFSEWRAEWLLDEHNAEIRRILIEQVGYEKICDELNAITLDTWREYTLLKIDEVEIVYEWTKESVDFGNAKPNDTEPMVLLKMTCPSTAHIHILRVPPEMVSAEAAITWVNHGIHPDEFAVQT
jgi:leucine-rich repeat protein SHOC2